MKCPPTGQPVKESLGDNLDVMCLVYARQIRQLSVVAWVSLDRTRNIGSTKGCALFASPA